MKSDLLRILDANANRAREALRVLEDCARFSLDDRVLTETLKRLRHDLAAALAMLPMQAALAARDTPGDVGTTIKTASEFRRESQAEVLTASAKRLSEALRSMEECAKALNPDAAAMLEKLRYRGYAAEQSLAAAAAQQSAVERFRRVKLCVLLTQAVCRTGTTWQSTLEEILIAAKDVPPGAVCIQLREKGLPDGEWLLRARHFVEQCQALGEGHVVSIINDRPDLALLSGADGVHLGQEDLPCEAARGALAGRMEKIVGVSTECVEQAQAAEAAGAHYIGAGPMFDTRTKQKPRIAGPAYLREATAAVKIPVIAIGGITLENTPTLLAAGARAIAVSSAIIGAESPGNAVRQFLKLL